MGTQIGDQGGTWSDFPGRERKLERSSKYPGWERKLVTKEEQWSDFPGWGRKLERSSECPGRGEKSAKGGTVV